MTYYEITILGHIDDYWSSTLEGLSITRLSEGKTLIGGNILDQSQLHSVLSKIRDMGLTLVELKQRAKE